MNSEITAVARGLKCGALAGITGAGLDDLLGQSVVLVQQVRQRQPADAAARAEEKVASRPARLACVMRHLHFPSTHLPHLPHAALKGPRHSGHLL
jgi:hypothetical protein